MNYFNELLDLDTAEISDALDSCGVEGALLGMRSIGKCNKLVGPAFTVKYMPFAEKPSEFHNAANYIDEVPSGSVIVIDNQGRTDCTTWGDILTHVALLRGIVGTVVYGAARDIDCIQKLKYPLFTSAVYMRSGKNRVYKEAQQCSLHISGVEIKPGDIIVADSNGVVAIPSAIVEEVVVKAKIIKSNEEAIISSVKSGISLEQARKQHNYKQPWVMQK